MATKIIICTNERTGSTFLANAMRVGGLGRPTEYFNDRAILSHADELGCKIDADQQATVANYVERLISNRSSNAVFSAKIHAGHARKWLLSDAGKLLFEDAYVVHLYRLDALAQTASYLAASSSGFWGSNPAIVGGRQSTTWPPSASRVSEVIKMLADGERFWRLFFAYRGVIPIPLTYEQLVEQPVSTLAGLAAGAKVAIDIGAVAAEAKKAGRYDIDLDRKELLVREVLPKFDWTALLRA